MEEQWKSIINYPNYEISNMGNCRTVLTNINLKPTMRGDYKIYRLYSCDENGVKTRKTLLIHRLIAIHFIPNPENKPEVDHINNDKLDNSITNLRWSTHSENTRNRNRNKNNKTSQYIGVGFNKSENKWKYQMVINGKNYTKRFNTEKEAAIKRDEFILDNNLEYFKLNFVHI